MTNQPEQDELDQALDKIKIRIEFEPNKLPKFVMDTKEAETDILAWHQSELRKAEVALAEEERSHENTILQRDNAEEWADKLAYAKFGVKQIGEHSSANNPWANAAELLEAEVALTHPKEQEGGDG